MEADPLSGQIHHADGQPSSLQEPNSDNETPQRRQAPHQARNKRQGACSGRQPQRLGREIASPNGARRGPGRPCKTDLDPASDLSDEQRKTLRRRLLNREYARRVWSKQQQLVEQLTLQVEQYREDLLETAKLLTADEQEIKLLHGQLQNMMCSTTEVSARNMELWNLYRQLKDKWAGEMSQQGLGSAPASHMSTGFANPSSPLLHYGQGDVFTTGRGERCAQDRHKQCGHCDQQCGSGQLSVTK